MRSFPQQGTVPESLRMWFLIHFLVDYLIAIPLFLFPSQVLSSFGWQTIDPIASRLVAAALFGIGGLYLISRRADTAVYKHLLALKIIWSLTAIAGILLTIAQQQVSLMGWIVLGLFIVFSFVWMHYYHRLSQ